MSWIPKEIENYCIMHSTRPLETSQQLQKETLNSVHASHMLIGELEGAILKFLIKLGQVKRVLEIGTFTGYSALVMAEALPPEGKVITIDINPHTTEIAKKYWDQSPHGQKIQLILKPGPEALKDLEGSAGFDLIFIDADKRNYPFYLEWGLKHLTDRGMIVTDNTLWSGKVLHPENSEDKQTTAIQEHNLMAMKLEGYTKVLLPIRDGMYLIQKS
jgi:caffeoyl-CoA O-methyltransferase